MIKYISMLDIYANNGIRFQNKIQGIFKKYNLKVEILDRNNEGHRPDFFVSSKDNPGRGFICECKFIASAGTIENGKYHISTLDSRLCRQGVFQYKSDKLRDKITQAIRKALIQHKELVRDMPFYQNFPFVIALETDFFASSVDFDKILNFITDNKNISKKEVHQISAIMEIQRNVMRTRVLKKLSDNDLEDLVKGKQKKIAIPPESVGFRVLLNPEASIKFKPGDFLNNPIIVYP